MKRATIPAAMLAALRSQLYEYAGKDDGSARLARAIDLLEELRRSLEDRRAIDGLCQDLAAFRAILRALVRGRSAPRPDERSLRRFGVDLWKRLESLGGRFREADYLVNSLAGHAPFEPGDSR